jgi:hypothetical protein
MKVEQSIQKGLHLNYRRRGITQKKAYEITEHGGSWKSRTPVFVCSADFCTSYDICRKNTKAEQNYITFRNWYRFYEI